MMRVNSLSTQYNLQIKSAGSLDSRQTLDKNKDLQEKPSSSDSEQKASEESTAAALADQKKLQQLKSRDREVRAHELAHISVGGRYVTSGANFTYEKGPNGRLYAVAGEVSIDTSEIPGDPRATLLKAQTVVRAALAPAHPSAQDRRVAAEATAIIQQANIEIAAMKRESDKQETGQNFDSFA